MVPACLPVAGVLCHPTVFESVCQRIASSDSLSTSLSVDGVPGEGAIATTVPDEIDPFAYLMLFIQTGVLEI